MLDRGQEAGRPMMRAAWLPLAAAALAGTACEPAVVDERPSIVVVVTDDQAFSTLAYMPAVGEHLVAAGVSLENFLINDPICCPSRATLLLGQYRHHHQLEWHQRGCTFRFLEQGQHEQALGVLLKERGYRTGFFGKYLNDYRQYLIETQETPDQRRALLGWDDYRILLERAFFGFVLHENGKVVPYAKEEDLYQTDVLARYAVDFIEQSGDEPFFLFVAPDAPHWPAEPAPRHRDRFGDLRAPRVPSFNEADVDDKPSRRSRPEPFDVSQVAKIDQVYQRMVRSLLAVDEMVDAIVAELRRTGRLDRTYFFYTSDNGYHYGEHRIPWGKATPYEESVRVPFVVRGPGIARGERRSQLAANLDLLPTVLDVVGAELPEGADGRSLLPLLAPGGESAPGRRALLLESVAEQRNDGVPSFVGLRTERFKWVEFTNGERELYDLSTDPHELENLVPAAPGEMAPLSARLHELVGCAGDGCRRIEDRAFPE
jgi:arylsulfatase A-like enzyme